MNQLRLVGIRGWIRNGNQVGYIKVKNINTDIIIYDYILSYLEKGHNSISVIIKHQIKPKYTRRVNKKWN
ncbi:MAG: hypothetical protein PHD03_04985 [Bacilli bacterium]|nr:hypothetical protein [Bacilli bacterium]MDD4407382.1 hypothetical protein [Bacilli bacterium]